MEIEKKNFVVVGYGQTDTPEFQSTRSSPGDDLKIRVGPINNNINISKSYFCNNVIVITNCNCNCNCNLITIIVIVTTITLQLQMQL